MSSLLWLVLVVILAPDFGKNVLWSRSNHLLEIKSQVVGEE